MLNRIIDAALSARWIVLMMVLALVAAGGYALYTMPVEAFPDLTNYQVTVATDAPSEEINDGRKRQQQAYAEQCESNGADAFHGDCRVPPTPFQNSPR